MIIDTHAHLVPAPMLEALNTAISRFPSIELLHEAGKYRLAFAGGAPTRPIAADLQDTDRRLEWMDRETVDVQIVGGWLDAFGYELPPDEGLEWARFTNEWLLAGTRSERLVPIATVPLQSGRHAATALEEALAAGFTGFMLGTQPFGASGNLDDPQLDPFWEAASDRGAALFLHPMFGCGDARLADYGMINAVGRGLDTTTAVARLLFSGHLEKYPGLKIVLSHGGGALPYLVGRLKRNHAIMPNEVADPVAGFRKLWFDSVLFDPASLRYLRDVVGADRIVLGSDYPFPIGDPNPVRIVRAAGLGADEERRILGETAASLFHVHEHARP